MWMATLAVNTTVSVSPLHYLYDDSPGPRSPATAPTATLPLPVTVTITEYCCHSSYAHLGRGTTDSLGAPPLPLHVFVGAFV